MQIVRELSGGEEKCVCELVDACKLGWSTVSRHLSVLREAGVIADEKRGLQVFYRLTLQCASRFIDCLDQPGRDTHLGASVEFFVYEAPKVLMLLALVVFGVGIVRTFFTPERTRRILSGKRESVGNVLAALLGIVTPFCSCSAVPLFIGFVTTGVPLGVTFSFLISAPMVNEVALIALSLPEAIILRKVLKPRLIATFFGIVALSIMLVGYLFNFLM